MSKSEMDRLNASFWDELCGSGLAQMLGITDRSPASLKRFDQAYLDFYPYLLGYIRPDRLTGKRVLEVGLGYGTVGQALLDSGANYFGVDIAAGPVNMIRYRQVLMNQPSSCSRASVLNLPFAAGSFDCVISIGVFHHTGDVQRAIDETHRVLKPGGKAILMVYNQYAYRQWFNWPLNTLKIWLREYGFIRSTKSIEVTEEQRKAYDASLDGVGAPETVFVSVRELRRMMRNFKIVRLSKENSSPLLFLSKKWFSWPLKKLFGIQLFKKPEGGFYLLNRSWLLPTLGRWFGLDLYVEAEKKLVEISDER
ncbi:MAG: methyltransferase domain-containing protein [Anaerolineae bacterium]|nr:methyltransferase domain-containing protein [Anaerolineae bacterium]